VEELLDNLGQDPDFIRLPLLSQVSVMEMATYMQHVLLRDTDQMSMAHALEVRVPFLDHELVELVLGLPDRIKYPRTPKQLLVESLGDLLPAEIVNRPKMGFALPFAHWMKHELRDFCHGKVQRLAERPQFNGSVVRAYWDDFLAGKQTISWSRLWLLVVLEHWLEKNRVN
jgi:asparagine synthase (glutamine-hydrolysing)